MMRRGKEGGRMRMSRVEGRKRPEAIRMNEL